MRASRIAAADLPAVLRASWPARGAMTDATTSGISGRRVRRSGAGCVRCSWSTTASLRLVKGGWPGQALEEHAAERVEVAPVVDLLQGGDLLGTHVRGGADGDSRAGQPVLARRRHSAGDAEVEEYRALRVRGPRSPA